MISDSDRLETRALVMARLRAELLQRQPMQIAQLAQEVARHHGPRVAAILFYGSCLRQRASDSLVDLYVIVDDYPVAPMSGLGAIAARVLPPTVYRHEQAENGSALTAKVAVISWAQMQARVRTDSVDTGIWARMCQPVALVYDRHGTTVDRVAALLVDAVVAAAVWAARLGPQHGTSGDFWETLFRHTYAAELRVEGPGRAAQIHGAAPERYRTLLTQAWRAAGLTLPEVDPAGTLTNPIPAAARRRHQVAWHWRRWSGHTLNLLRLVKAGFTFDAGADYIAWKAQRHTGRSIALSPFQRRHPVLAAPSILWLLIRARLAR